jgi:hypothetical protein
VDLGCIAQAAAAQQHGSWRHWYDPRSSSATAGRNLQVAREVVEAAVGRLAVDGGLHGRVGAYVKGTSKVVSAPPRIDHKQTWLASMRPYQAAMLPAAFHTLKSPSESPDRCLVSSGAFLIFRLVSPSSCMVSM